MRSCRDGQAPFGEGKKEHNLIIVAMMYVGLLEYFLEFCSGSIGLICCVYHISPVNLSLLTFDIVISLFFKKNHLPRIVSTGM
jgi:hypothetical protein